MTEKNFSQFVSMTRGVPVTVRGDEIELDGVVLGKSDRDALVAEFEAWTPPDDANGD